MKAIYKPTGCTQESNDELTVAQWKKRPDLYEEVSGKSKTGTKKADKEPFGELEKE